MPYRPCVEKEEVRVLCWCTLCIGQDHCCVQDEMANWPCENDYVFAGGVTTCAFWQRKVKNAKSIT
jgi:hypothetical protein